ncbi:MAG: hypothetical protein J7K65_06365 [Planctomycetes bacterium]|nr:hypothetical protein [Planctomycetota bacterium]
MFCKSLNGKSQVTEYRQKTVTAAKVAVVIAFVLLEATVQSAYGEYEVVGVTIEDYSSYCTEGQQNELYAPVYLVNGSGLVSDLHANNQNGAMWLTEHSKCGGGSESPETVEGEYVTFDLGRLIDLESTKIWNWNGAVTPSVCVKKMKIWVAGDVDDPSDPASFQLHDPNDPNIILTQNPCTGLVEGEMLGLDTSISVRYVKFEVIENYGEIGSYGYEYQAVGLSEVKFYGPPPPVSPKTTLQMTHGRPVIYIDGKPRVPFLFRGNYQPGSGNQTAMDNTVNQIQRSYGFGQRMFGINTSTNWWHTYDDINADLAERMDVAPEGKFFISMAVTPNYDWANAYPSEIYTNEAGSPLKPHPTVESSRWRSDASDKVYDWTLYLRNSPYIDNVFALNLTCHETAEWFLAYAWDDTKHYDFSYVNVTGFRTWLRTKYNDTVSALRSAWNSSSVTFDNAAIPSSAERVSCNNDALWNPLGGGTQMKVVDYYDYMANSNADSVISITNNVKNLTDSRYLLAASWGYIFELDWALNRGAHSKLSRVIKDSAVDMFWGPYAYGDRFIGGTPSMHGPFDSIAINGKLYMAEDDTLSHVVDFGYTDGSDAQYTEVGRRDYFYSFIHNFGLWRLDLASTGVYDADKYWIESAKWLQISKAKLFDQGTYTPEMLAFVEEDSVPYLADVSDPHSNNTNKLSRPLHNLSRRELERAGTSVGFYLTQDLEDHNPLLPDTGKLLVFMDQIKTDAAQIASIRSWLDGKDITVVWIYAPGLITDSFDESAMEQLTGITLRVDNNEANLQTKITNGTHPLTQGHLNEIFGTSEQYGPKVYVDDPQATSLGQYRFDTSRISMAIKQVGTWESVFIGTPSVPSDVFEMLTDYAGCKKFTDEQDIVTRNGSMLMIHTKDLSGNRVIEFPDTGDSSYEVYDVFNDQVVASVPGQATVYLQGFHTYLYILGSRDQQFGIFPLIPETDDEIEMFVIRGLYGSQSYGYSWYQNGVLQADLVDKTVPASRTSTGDQWLCELFVDGSKFGEETVFVSSSDLNRSGFIDIQDLRKFAELWLTSADDVNLQGSDLIDFYDFAEFAAGWIVE